METVFYCNLSPFKCKPYNPLGTCSGFGSLLKTSSILSYKTQPCAETLQAAHLLTISWLKISILRHFCEHGGLCLGNHPQKHRQVFPVSVSFDEPHFEHHHLPCHFQKNKTKQNPTRNEMLLVAKEVSFPDFANSIVVPKSALHGSDPPCLSVKGHVGPAPWQTEALSPNPNSQVPLQQIRSLLAPKSYNQGHFSLGQLSHPTTLALVCAIHLSPPNSWL